jgi:hypothetical protein
MLFSFENKEEGKLGKVKRGFILLYLFRGTRSRDRATLKAEYHEYPPRDIPNDPIVEEVYHP